MNITERAEAQLEITMKWRREAWEVGGIRDTPPMIGWLTEGRSEYDHAPWPVVRDLYQQAGDDSASVVYSVIKHVAAEPDFTRLREIIFVVESYGFKDEGLPPESLENDFKTNPSSKVVEQITVIIVADDLVGGAEAAVAMQPYRISDGGQMVFGEPEVAGPGEVSAVDSQIVEAMKWGVLHAHET
jgi:hypothetical protein